MLLADEMKIKIYNEISAKIENLESRNLQAEAQFMNAITPLVYAERILQREIEVLYVQEKLLETYLNAATPIDYTALNKCYRTSLEELEKDFIEGYKTLLKARSQIFEQGCFIPLTKENRSQKLKEFYESPDFREQMSGFKSFIVTSTDNLSDMCQKIKNKKQESLAKLSALIDEKTEPSQKLLDVGDKLNSNKHSLMIKREESLNQLDQSLSALCYRGEVDKVKHHLSKQIASRRAEVINELHADGLSVFHYACLNPQVDMIRLLLEAGA